MGHMQGGKVTKAHTTVTESAERVAKVAEKLPEVTKIVLGVITQGLPSGQTRIKCIPITGGLRVEVRGPATKQQLFIYTSDVRTTEAALHKAFAGR